LENENDFMEQKIKIRNQRLKVNADISQFYLLWDNKVDTEKINVVGEFHNHSNKEIDIPIVVSDETLRALKMPRLAFRPIEKNYITESFIVISNEFYHEIENNPYLICFLWHEIGHFHTLQYFKERSDMSAVRREYIINEESCGIEDCIYDYQRTYYSNDGI